MKVPLNDKERGNYCHKVACIFGQIMGFEFSILVFLTIVLLTKL